MDDKKMQNIVDQMLKQATNADPHILGPDGEPANGELSQIEVLAVIAQNLEMGMMQLAKSQQHLGIALDTSRLTIQMLVSVLVEKDVLNEEEFKERYKTDVADKMIEMQKQLQEEYEKHQAKQQAIEQGGCTQSEDCNKEVENCSPDCDCHSKNESIDSDVVLPSEREGNVVRFPAKKE